MGTLSRLTVCVYGVHGNAGVCGEMNKIPSLQAILIAKGQRLFYSPVETSEEIPVETLVDVPVETLVDTPVDTPVDALFGTPDDAPVETPVVVGSRTSRGISGDRIVCCTSCTSCTSRAGCTSCTSCTCGASGASHPGCRISGRRIASPRVSGSFQLSQLYQSFRSSRWSDLQSSDRQS
jgi:hypothetical protein